MVVLVVGVVYVLHLVPVVPDVDGVGGEEVGGLKEEHVGAEHLVHLPVEGLLPGRQLCKMALNPGLPGSGRARPPADRVSRP